MSRHASGSPTPLESIVEVGVTGLVDAREAVMDAAVRPGALRGLNGDLSEALILTTCNRIELYGTADDPEYVIGAFRRIVSPRSPGVFDAPEVRTAERAVEHLFRVAGGLDSAVLGESEILGQVRAAAQSAAEAGTLGPILGHVSRSAVRAGRRVRRETGLATGVGSYAAAALRAAERTLGDLAGQPLLLIGAGAVARRIAKMAGHRGLGRVTIANRTRAGAEALAGAIEAAAIDLDDLESALGAHQLIVIAVAGAPALVPLAGLAGARGVCVCDLSSPPVTYGPPPPNVTLHGLSEIVREVDGEMAARRAAAPAAERLLREEVAATTEWLAGRAAVTAARAIQDHLERVRREELEKFESRLRRLDPDERELVERITKSILKTMLHRPLRSLRDPVHGSDLAGALSRLFGLDRDPDAPDADDRG